MEGVVASFAVGTEARLPGGTLLSVDEGANDPSCVHVCDAGTCMMHDLQLAAELGKTLLERNKELETGLKQQQTVIDDQSQEIEYLSKQSVALREVNDSRLRVYEQLEVSIHELEITNQRLQDETTRDKKRIRSLTQSVECLELRAAELQALVEELRSAEQSHRAAAATAAAAAASQQRAEEGRRDSDTEVPSSSEQLSERLTLLEHQLTEARGRERQERERRQWAETEVSTAQEECCELRHEMAALRERSVKLHTLAEEVHAMEEQRLSPFLRQCSPRACSASPQMAAASQHAGEPHGSVWGEDVVRWAGAEHVTAAAPAAASAAAEEPGSAPASLIGDLDAHYRVLLDHMDKYEWLLTSRPARPATPDQPGSLSLLEELQLSAGPPPPTSLRAAALLRDSGPASLMMLGAASDGDASSSGFSEGSEGSRAVSRATQTPEVTQTPPPQQTVAGAAAGAAAGEAAGTMGQRKVTTMFQHTPQYKQLFQDIFQVLKKPVVVSPTLASTTATVTPTSAPATGSTSPSAPSSAGSPATAAAETSSWEAPAEAEEEMAVSRAATAAEAAPPAQVEPLSQPTRPATQSSSANVSLLATLPAEALSVGEETEPVLSSSDIVESLPRFASGRSRSTSASRTFSYAEEYDRCLRASTPAAADGASEVSLGGGSSGGEEFPLLGRPSEEVAKLRLLERSYAEALKAGRRCFYRPTLL